MANCIIFPERGMGKTTIGESAEEIRRAFERLKIPELTYEREKYKPYFEGKWILEEPYELAFPNKEDYERTKAMIEFCTNYEPELFQQFYKWFKLKGKED